jgi:hypothetical protein
LNGGVPVSASVSVQKQDSFIYSIAFMVLIAVIVTSAGVYGYSLLLKNNQTKLVTEIKKKQSLIDMNLIQKVSLLNQQILDAKQLVQNHYVLTPFFASLHRKALRDIQFDSFEYIDTPAEKSPEGPSASAKTDSYTVILKGKARSYETIAQQSDEFYAPEENGVDSLLKRHFFSDFRFDKEKSLIEFSVTVNLLPDQIRFKPETPTDITSTVSETGEISLPAQQPPPSSETELPADTEVVPGQQVGTLQFSVPPSREDRGVSLQKISEALVKNEIAKVE